jgi:hypothetical protein
MPSSEEHQILSEFRQNKFSEVPTNRSNRRFLGHYFASIAMNHISKYVPMEKYVPVLGPVWIKGLEWVEWDGAVVKKDSKEIFPHCYDPSDIAVIFEFKVSGIYGLKTPRKGKKTVQEVVENIKGNFEAAKGLYKNLGCFYISLHERRPDPNRKQRRGAPINYYAETKKLPADITTCILFNSRSFEKSSPEQLDSWAEMIGKLDALLAR